MENINVGMGECKISKAKDSNLVAPGLGSCIGLILYDPINKIGAMAHVVLPDSTTTSKEITTPGKYADTAVPYIIEQITNAGANKRNLVVSIAGGAQMFTLEKGSNVLNIGTRNNIAVKAALTKAGLKLNASDTGGNKGRTLRIDINTGTVYVRSIGQPEIILGGNL